MSGPPNPNEIAPEDLLARLRARAATKLADLKAREAPSAIVARLDSIATDLDHRFKTLAWQRFQDATHPITG
jgi:hypothetical protein